MPRTVTSKDPGVRRQLEEIREFFDFLETEQAGIRRPAERCVFGCTPRRHALLAE
jgi:hypothetical protein